MTRVRVTTCHPRPLTTANQQAFMAHGIGDLIITVPNGSDSTHWHLHGTLYTPALGFTLVSIGQVDDAGFFSNFGDGHCLISQRDGTVVGIILKSGGLYRTLHASPAGLAAHKLPCMSLRELHKHCGHIDPNPLLDLAKRDVICVQLTNRDTSFKCCPCKLAKLKKAPISSIREGERGQAFGDEIHSDIWGPAKLETFGKRTYFVSYTDNWSRWTTCYLLFSIERGCLQHL